jgi:hypothetical protein
VKDNRIYYLLHLNIKDVQRKHATRQLVGKQ